MKAFFVILLFISILIPLCNLIGGLEVMVHNQYDRRLDHLRSTESSGLPGGHLGLTARDLATLDNQVAFAYTDAVRDGYRLGLGFSALWFESMALDGLLFVSSLVGLCACRNRRQTPNQSLEPTAGRCEVQI